MTEAMPFLRKPILLSYDPRPWARGRCFSARNQRLTAGKGDLIAKNGR